MLDLSEVCLDHDHELESVQYSFSATILPGISVTRHEVKDGEEFYLQLALVDGTLYRLAFSLSTIAASNSCLSFLKCPISLPQAGFAVEHAPVCCTFSNSTAIFANSDGVVTAFEFPFPFENGKFTVKVTLSSK